MSRRLGKLSAGVATTGIVLGAVAVLTAGTAAAATTYATGTVAYMCNFPGIGQQQLDVKANFVGPDSVASGGTATPSSVGGTATINATINALLNAANYDGVRGKANMPITATNATPTSATVTNLDVPTQINPYVPGPRSFNIVQDAGTGVPTLTAGAPGSGVISLGTTINAPLDFHKKDGTWTAWNFNCTVKNTNPAQNRAFSPAIPIT
ncbi:hypothetical protein ED92_24170 [Amycolatopsis sp. MJM2582]|nr:MULTISPECIES: DUF6801 domain-containing protein [Amycolatopsis]KFZ80456.1 hypothetical protein ED92_24170 [Amycolatopsis sp. MJM2582]OLZ58816.1 hypothetical protein BS330_10415 [Amycolatopsis keratiniphila subsp. nogabecina]SDU69914.1 hypothetical protein SAMN04489733_8599 [Amycolatopsis keratiniphila]